MDILDMVYHALISDDYIKEQAFDRIKFFEYPETGEVTAPFIIIDPVEPLDPSNFADNSWLKYDCFIQIDVWTPVRVTTNTLADKIRDVLWERFGLKQKSGPQEYEDGVFRDARRYTGTIYRNDLDSL